MRFVSILFTLLLCFSARGAGDRDGRGNNGRDREHGNGHGKGHAKIPKGRDDTINGKVWKGHKHDGDACPGDIAVLVNGYTLSILFDDFDIDFPMGDPGGDGMQKRKHCNFSVDLTPPEGTYLAGFRQVFSGGMIKSKGAQARLNIQYRLGGPPQSKDIHWKQGDQINPDSPNSIFSQVFDDVIPPRNRCRETQKYILSLDLSALRRDRTDYMQGGLDTLDAEASPTVSVVPQWKPCR